MKYVFGNWKMNHANKDVVLFIKNFKKQKMPQGITYGLAVPFLYLQKIGQKLSKKCEIGVQNVCFAQKGEYTGEISAQMLADFCCSFCLVGHSERRVKFFETDEQINQKIILLFQNNIMPILCVGETKEDYLKKNTKKVLRSQLLKALKNIPLDKKFMVAYEPIWAIGTGLTPTKKEIDENVSYIKKVLENDLKKSGICVLYGGSINPQNARELLSGDIVDGALVGGASLDAQKFVEIGKNLT